MGYDEKVIEILVGSPNDVNSERRLLDELVTEFNRTWSRSLHARLELVKWETHSRPGVGEDAQAVINEQLPETYDVFIGIFWTRLGTPTGRASSGTAEEVQRSLERFRQDPTKLQVLIYFSDAPVAPNEVDAEQFSALRTFERSLQQEQGVFSHRYKTLDEFAALVRSHLAKLAQTWDGAWPTPKAPSDGSSRLRLSHASARSRSDSEAASQGTQDTEDQEDGEQAADKSARLNRPLDDVATLTDSPQGPDRGEESEEGFLELVELADTRFDQVSRIVDEITRATQRLGDETAQKAQEMSEAQSDASKMKQLVNRIASDLEDFSSVVEERSVLYSAAYPSALNAFAKVAMVSADFGEQGRTNVEQGLVQLGSMGDAIIGGREGMRSMRQSIASVPRLTTRFTHARKRALAALDEWDKRLSESVELVEEVRALLTGLLASGESAVSR